MYLKRLVLKNWKAYVSASFDFPAPEDGKNIILIGAQNGFGKTSLWEAIVLGLFGEHGLHSHVLRSSPSDDTSYRKFLQSALHSGTIGGSGGAAFCSIKLTLAGGEGKEVTVERKWHFGLDGQFLKDGEQAFIYEGSDRELVKPPLTPLGNDSDDLNWYLKYISKKLIPPDQAKFFLFDGEMVSELAKRDQASQVQHGIEGLLGVLILKELKDHLKEYGDARRRNAPAINDERIERAERDLDAAKSQEAEKKADLAALEPKMNKLVGRRDALHRELRSLGADPSREQRLLTEAENLHKLEQEVLDLERDLENRLSKDIPLALPGKGLRERLMGQLKGEEKRKKWEAGKQQSDNKLGAFNSSVRAALTNVRPALLAKQQDTVVEIASEALRGIWYPPPKDISPDIVHQHLSESDRTLVIDELNRLANIKAPEIGKLLDRISADRKEITELRRELHRTEVNEPQINEKRKELSEVQHQLDMDNQTLGNLKREIIFFGKAVGDQRSVLMGLLKKREDAQPRLRKAIRALEVESAVDAIVSRAVPSQIAAVGEAMTKAYKDMAHKKDLIDRISIDEECNVKLLNAQGVDLRRFDFSAGEDQIFTQALFSAVISVSQLSFPTVIDTPLGRLDDHHRKGVLSNFARRKSQVILLSTDTEVIGEYLEEIEPHVQKQYLIQFKRTGDIGESTVHEGYFDKEGGPP